MKNLYKWYSWRDKARAFMKLSTILAIVSTVEFIAIIILLYNLFK